MVEVGARDFVGCTVVVATHLDDDQVGVLLPTDVELFGVVVVHFTSTSTGIGGAVPPPGLDWVSWVAIKSEGEGVVCTMP